MVFTLLIINCSYVSCSSGVNVEKIAEMSIVSIPPGAKLPVQNNFRVPTKRNPGTDDYWFPIGWVMFLHDYLDNIPVNGDHAKPGGYPYTFINNDWEYGELNKITTNTTDNPWNWVLGLPSVTLLRGY